MAKHLNEETFDTFMARSASPVLVDFYRDGCVPCRRVAPLLSQVETEYAGRMEVVRVNIEQNPALIRKYRIEAAPTLLLLRGGKEAGRHKGVIDKDTLKTFVEAVL